MLHAYDTSIIATAKRKGELFTRVSAKKLSRLIMAEQDAIQAALQSSPVERERSEAEFLLLDVRSPEEYDKCHIAFCKFLIHVAFLSNTLLKQYHIQ